MLVIFGNPAGNAYSVLSANWLKLIHAYS